MQPEDDEDPIVRLQKKHKGNTLPPTEALGPNPQ